MLKATVASITSPEAAIGLQLPGPRASTAGGSPVIAVLVPCLNEAACIEKVIADFRAALPNARIFVYDNGSTDGSIEVARDAGAIVRVERARGKGNVVRRMFADIEADLFILVDGDDTYDAASAPMLVDLLVSNSLDMVSAARRSSSVRVYRRGHALGNRVLSRLVALVFGDQISDLLSGYRVFSRRFVKSFPALSSGFEIETELSVHALQLRMPIGEIYCLYRERPAGSHSKLSTYKDGLRILRTIVYLVKEEKPLAFFSAFAAALTLLSLVLGIPVVVQFMHTGLVPRLPTALLAAAVGMLAFMSVGCGLVLDTVSRGRAEAKRLCYLGLPLRFNPVRPSEPLQVLSS